MAKSPQFLKGLSKGFSDVFTVYGLFIMPIAAVHNVCHNSYGSAILNASLFLFTIWGELRFAKPRVICKKVTMVKNIIQSERYVCYTSKSEEKGAAFMSASKRDIATLSEFMLDALMEQDAVDTVNKIVSKNNL